MWGWIYEENRFAAGEWKDTPGLQACCDTRGLGLEHRRSCSRNICAVKWAVGMKTWHEDRTGDLTPFGTRYSLPNQILPLPTRPSCPSTPTGYFPPSPNQPIASSPPALPQSVNPLLPRPRHLQEHVVGLQVTMDQPLGVQVLQGASDLTCRVHDLAHLHELDVVEVGVRLVEHA